jgi:hypothetical protein
MMVLDDGSGGQLPLGTIARRLLIPFFSDSALVVSGQYMNDTCIPLLTAISSAGVCLCLLLHLE